MTMEEAGAMVRLYVEVGNCRFHVLQILAKQYASGSPAEATVQLQAAREGLAQAHESLRLEYERAMEELFDDV